MADLPKFESSFLTAKGREKMLSYKPATLEKRTIMMGECLSQLGLHSFVGRTLLVATHRIRGVELTKPTQLKGLLTGYDYPEELVLNMENILMLSADVLADEVEAKDFIQVPLQQITSVTCVRAQNA